MQLQIFQVDAFSDRIFGGNPAAVVPLSSWLDDSKLLAIAAENNLSETAFLVPNAEGYQLRWFTPTTEIDLCGHATLASAWTLFNRLGLSAGRVRFESRSGELSVHRAENGRLALDFPSRPATPIATDEHLARALGGRPLEMLRARDTMVVYESVDEVLALKPDTAMLAASPAYAVIVTAPGAQGIDFVSRFFAPKQGIPEDPVTGSAHCTLIPYWSKRLGKTKLRAKQVSSRGGDLYCEDRGDRVIIAGHCALYLEGAIHV